MIVRVTVIVPIYNVEKYLEECISSLICQSEKFDEIILINDGSTDSSEKICEKYVAQYSNIIFINQTNQGLAATRNLGIKKATGDYVIFVDSDDYLHRNACAAIKNALQEKEMEVLYYNADIQYDIRSTENKDAFIHKDSLNGQYMTGIEYFKSAFPKGYTVSACVAAYNIGFLRKYKIIFPEGLYYEDNFFSLQVISNAKIVTGIRESLYIRRCREDSIMTSGLSEKKCRDLIANQRLMWEYIFNHSNWISEKDLVRKYISFEVLHTFFKLSQYDNEKVIIHLKYELVSAFIRLWKPVFQEEYKSIEAHLAFLLILKEASRNLKVKCYSPEVQLYEQIESTKRKVCGECMERLSALPFNGGKVGIYGIGDHTRTLLELYQKEFGKIQAELFFITSQKNENQKQIFMNRKVFTYQDIPEDFDYIVISSYVYQGEMYMNLLNQEVKKEKIILLYTETSACDLVMIQWVMNY